MCVVHVCAGNGSTSGVWALFSPGRAPQLAGKPTVLLGFLQKMAQNVIGESCGGAAQPSAGGWQAGGSSQESSTVDLEGREISAEALRPQLWCVMAK